jgi:hypothetical protein
MKYLFIRKANCLVLTYLTLLFATTQKILAQEDVTSLYLVNPDFEYISDGVKWSSIWRGDPWGWNREGEIIGNSLGISNDGVGHNGKALCWYRSIPMPDSFVLSQTIENAPAGSYRISCKMTNFTGLVTNQRLFANNFSHYFGSKEMYDKNIDTHEFYSFAGLTPTGTNYSLLQDMSFDVLLYEGETLTVGVKSSNKLADGSKCLQGSGWFKVDDFRIHYLGGDAQYFIDFLNTYISVGDSLVALKMGEEAKTQLIHALAEGKSITVATPNSEIKSATLSLISAIEQAEASIKEHKDKPNAEIGLIMDMVHHNPGDKLYNSSYNHPDVLAEMGYNSKCFYLFDSPTLAINWDGFDQNILPLNSDDRKWVEAKAHRLDSLYDECKANNIDVYAMCDLILLPKRLISLYNIQDRFGNPQDTLVQRILRYQIEQSFSQFPQLDGLVVRIGETYLQDAPYHQGSIQNKTNAETCIIPLMELLKEVICEKLNKKLVFRTWMSFDEDLSLYNKVSSSVAPHDNLYFGVKHCEGDFHRGSPFSKVLGQGRHKQIVEVQCAREYEGKGAFPNYVARNVIDGFEEHISRQENGLYWNLRDIYNSGLLSGVWTWTRGGGWEGPYIKNEIWCDMNAWIMAQWAKNPQSDEDSLFTAYTTRRLGLNDQNAQIIRKIALLSEHATIRGLRSVAYPENVFNMWVRDEYITFPDMPSDKMKAAAILKERDEAVADWDSICVLAQQFNDSRSQLNEVIKVTCEYGKQMYRIFRSVCYLAAIHKKVYDAKARFYIDDYNDAWSELEKLASDYPETCPTLFTRDKTLRTSSTAADPMIKSLMNGKIDFRVNTGIEQRDITVRYLNEARNFARSDEPVNNQYKRYGQLKNWTVENLGIDMGSNGINNGADQYNGMCEINMDQWYNGFIGKDSKIYRKITLPAGRYGFNAYATSCYGMEEGSTYMFVSKELPTTDNIATLESCNYINIAKYARLGWWGIEFTLEQEEDVYLGWCADFTTGNYELRISDIQLVRAVDEENGLISYDDETIQSVNDTLYIPVNQWADKGTFQSYVKSCQVEPANHAICRFADWKDRTAYVGDVNFEDGKYDLAYFLIKYTGEGHYGNDGTNNLLESNSIDIWIDNTTDICIGDAGAVKLNGTHIATLPGTEIDGVMTSYKLYAIPLHEPIEGVHSVWYKQNGYSPLIQGIGFIDTDKEQEEEIIFTFKTNYGTLILPFNAELQQGLEAYTCSDVETDGVTLKLSPSESIEANTPYIIKKTGDVNEYRFCGVPNNLQSSYTVGLLTGTLTDMVAQSGSYVFQDQETELGFYKVLADDITIHANRVYIKEECANIGTNALMLPVDATNITDVNINKQLVEVYTISGVKVKEKIKNSTALNGLEKGVYIINGQKVIK